MRANELGIYDMSGNVWEWCLDWYASYPPGPVSDPRGSSSGSYRVSRGGSWFIVASLCRVANRYYGPPSLTYYFLGFRVALGPSQ